MTSLCKLRAGAGVVDEHSLFSSFFSASLNLFSSATVGVAEKSVFSTLRKYTTMRNVGEAVTNDVARQHSCVQPAAQSKVLCGPV